VILIARWLHVVHNASESRQSGRRRFISNGFLLCIISVLLVATETVAKFSMFLKNAFESVKVDLCHTYATVPCPSHAFLFRLKTLSLTTLLYQAAALPGGAQTRPIFVLAGAWLSYFPLTCVLIVTIVSL